MRTAYYFSWHLHQIAFGTVLDQFKSDLKEGRASESVFLSCNGAMKVCSSNATADPAVCANCRFAKETGYKTIRKQAPDTKFKYLEGYCSYQEAMRLFQAEQIEYNSVADLKALYYKGVAIGYGALSTYISWTRNHQPSFNPEFKAYFNQLLVAQILLKEAIDRFQEEFKAEELVIFNGRRTDVRAVYDTALESNIPLRNLENFKIDNKDQSKILREVYYNCLPQDLKNHHHRALEAWAKSEDSESKKVEIGEQFFLGRRNFGAIRQKFSYIEGQDASKLPQSFDTDKLNIVMFNSSDDEKVALGKDYDQHNLFKTQIEGIKKVASSFSNEKIRLYLRVHPNLKKVDFAYHKDLYELEYPNLEVIPASSDVSSYQLLDHADLVIVFNSSMGVEASFQKKPVLILGSLEYYHFDVGTKPQSVENLTAILKEIDNTAGVPQELYEGKDVPLYGYYKMNPDSYSTSMMYSPKVIKLGSKELLLMPHLNYLGSRLLYKLKFALKARKYRLSPNESLKSLPL